ncbi:MAG: hypothetical protein ACOCZ8_06535 [Bacteroidota bacterium]
MKRLLCTLAGLLFSTGLWAQNADIRLGDDAYQLLDRADIKGWLNEPLWTGVAPIGRDRAADWLSKVDTNALAIRDKKWLHRVRWRIDDSYATTRERGFLKYFYRNQRDLLHYQSDDLKYRVYVNPIVDFQLGRENTDFAADSRNLFVNTRGVQVRGSAFGMLGFYTEFMDNQMRAPINVHEYQRQTGAVPGEGYWKPFGDANDGYDFFASKAYLTFQPIDNFRLKFGRDNSFFGNGYQSMLMSNHAVEHLQLSYDIKFWKIQYHTQIAQFIEYIPNKADAFGAYPRKYGVYHSAYYRPIKELTFGVHEATIYAPDQPNGFRGFELQYLNPIIFYRSIEQYVGSPDNAMLGASFKANALKRFQFYGQFMLDDFNLSETRNGSGWRGNTWGWQLGAKYIDVFGINTLDLQLETNSARPYAYAHYNPSANMASFDQAIAHPLGANFRELVALVRYRPISRLNLQLTVGYASKGDDDPTNPDLNFGGDISRSNATFNNGLPDPNFGNDIGQGIENNILRAQLFASYELRFIGMHFDLNAYFRDDNGLTTFGAMAGLRWNLPSTQYRF